MALDRLTDRERELIGLRFGGDLTGPRSRPHGSESRQRPADPLPIAAEASRGPRGPGHRRIAAVNLTDRCQQSRGASVLSADEHEAQLVFHCRGRVLAALVVPATALAKNRHHHRTVPPGNSGIGQYLENVPGAGGNHPSPGAGSGGGSPTSAGGSGGGASSVPPSVTQTLDNQGGPRSRRGRPGRCHRSPRRRRWPLSAPVMGLRARAHTPPERATPLRPEPAAEPAARASPRRRAARGRASGDWSTR